MAEARRICPVCGGKGKRTVPIKLVIDTWSRGCFSRVVQDSVKCDPCDATGVLPSGAANFLAKP